jgi:hypothetical protein
VKETARSHWHRSLEKAHHGVDCLRDAIMDLKQLTYATTDSNQQEYVLTNRIPGTFSAQQGVHRQALALVATLKQLENDSNDLTTERRPRLQPDDYNIPGSPAPSKAASFDRRALRKLGVMQQETNELLQQATRLIDAQKATMLKKRGDETVGDALGRQLKKKMAKNVAASKSQSALDFVLWTPPEDEEARLRAVERERAEVAATSGEDEAKNKVELKQKARVRVDFAEYIRYHWIRFMASASTTMTALREGTTGSATGDGSSDGVTSEGGEATAASAQAKTNSSKLASILSAGLGYGRFCIFTKCMGLMLTPQLVYQLWHALLFHQEQHAAVLISQESDDDAASGVCMLSLDTLLRPTNIEHTVKGSNNALDSVTVTATRFECELHRLCGGGSSGASAEQTWLKSGALEYSWIQALEWTRLFYSKTASTEPASTGTDAEERRQLSRQGSRSRSLKRLSTKGSSRVLDKARAASLAAENDINKRSHIVFWYNKRTGQIGGSSANTASAALLKMRLQGEGRLYTTDQDQSTASLPAFVSAFTNGSDPLLPPIREDTDAPTAVLDALHDLAAANVKPLLTLPTLNACTSPTLHACTNPDPSSVGASSCCTKHIRYAY